MKRIILLTLVVFAGNLFAQKYSDQKLHERLVHFQKMQNTGKKMVIGGVVLHLVGIPLYVSALSDLSKNSGKDADPEYIGAGSVFKAFGGVVAMAVGQLALAGGITFWAFGSSRIKTYHKLLEKNELKLNVDQKGIGLQLSF